MAIYRAYVISGPRRTSLWDKLRLAAAGVLGLVIVGAALLISLSLLFILIPIGVVVYLFRGRIAAALLRRAGVQPPPSQAAEAPREAGRDGVTIDADYVVVDRDRRRPQD